MTSDEIRDLLFLPSSEYETQLNQDVFALLVNRLRPGYFVEVGANDGYTLSNTIYLESQFGWRGLLVEANPRYASSLHTRDGSEVVLSAVSSQPGPALFIDDGLFGALESFQNDEREAGAPAISVSCQPLPEILDAVHAPEVVDFISIDVEGGELEILRSTLPGSRRFRCGCVEHNYRREDYHEMRRVLERSGYEIIWRDQTKHDLFFVDETLNDSKKRNDGA
jgi:FkbM family methyltransferase